ncbi:LCP family protein [Corynebacterium sp. H128]|uniref:LCP family protein n=1 Tax=unclassified Corynebacterium TaxID=2624378 RepID=UPI0030B05C12
MMLAALSALVLIVSGVGYSLVGNIGNDIASAGGLSLGGGGKGVKNAKDGATDILLVGSDSRTDAQGNPLSDSEIGMLRAGDEENDNTDTIMVIRVPNDGSSATAISIPRDTYIKDSELGNTKINGVYRGHKSAKREELMAAGMTDESKLESQSTDAGRKALIDTVAKLSGITVDHYAEIGLLGFVLFTDAVGGVEVCLNEDTQDEYSGANFHKGVQTLQGPDALSFVRQRHGLPRGDLDRIVRQQAFMASLVSQALETGTLTNPGKLQGLSQAVRRSVVIDEDWDVMSFATQLQNLAGGNVRFETIPVTSIDGVGDYGESVVTINPEEVHAFFNTLLGSGATATPTPTSTPKNEAAKAELHVLNATTTEGFASQVASAMKNAGYQVIDVGNAPAGMYSQTQVVAASASSPAAQALAAELGGVPVAESPSLDQNSLVLVVSDDYSGPRSNETLTPAESEGESVGQPGADFGEDVEVAPSIDAGGNGPRCVN